MNQLAAAAQVGTVVISVLWLIAVGIILPWRWGK